MELVLARFLIIGWAFIFLGVFIAALGGYFDKYIDGSKKEGA